jgi:hypothetical protein
MCILPPHQDLTGPLPTPMELAVIKAICDKHPDDRTSIESQLATAKVISRENTGAGFYTYFEVQRSPNVTIGDALAKDLRYGPPGRNQRRDSRNGLHSLAEARLPRLPRRLHSRRRYNRARPGQPSIRNCAHLRPRRTSPSSPMTFCRVFRCLISLELLSSLR